MSDTDWTGTINLMRLFREDYEREHPAEKPDMARVDLGFALFRHQMNLVEGVMLPDAEIESLFKEQQ
jgi:hypothetical protein